MEATQSEIMRASNAGRSTVKRMANALKELGGEALEMTSAECVERDISNSATKWTTTARRIGRNRKRGRWQTTSSKGRTLRGTRK